MSTTTGGPLSSGDLVAYAEAWLVSLRKSGRAENTVAAYGGDVSQYVRFLAVQGRTDVRLLEQDDVESFVRYFGETPGRTGRLRADSSVARVVSAVRVFHRWLHEIGVTVEDVAAGVPPPQAVRITPVALDRGDVAELLSSITGKEPIDLRDKAVLSLLVGTGIRAAELVDLDIAHVAPKHDGIDVPGELRRHVPVTDARALRAWLDHGRAQIVVGTQEAVFLNVRGRRLTRQGVWRLVTQRSVAAGLPRGTSPRTLRTTFAELERAAGTDEADVLALLGLRP